MSDPWNRALGPLTLPRDSREAHRARPLSDTLLKAPGRRASIPGPTCCFPADDPAGLGLLRVSQGCASALPLSNPFSGFPKLCPYPIGSFFHQGRLFLAELLASTVPVFPLAFLPPQLFWRWYWLFPGVTGKPFFLANSVYADWRNNASYSLE